MVPRYLPGVQTGSLRRQYEWWVTHGLKFNAAVENRAAVQTTMAEVVPLPAVLILYKVGRYYELYDQQARIAQELLRLRPRVGLRGFRHGCGFHRKWVSRYVESACRLGFVVALMGEYKNSEGRSCRRLVRLCGSLSRQEGLSSPLHSLNYVEKNCFLAPRCRKVARGFVNCKFSVTVKLP